MSRRRPTTSTRRRRARASAGWPSSIPGSSASGIAVPWRVRRSVPTWSARRPADGPGGETSGPPPMVMETMPTELDPHVDERATLLLRELAGPDAQFREHQLEAVRDLVADRARVLCVQRT